MAIPATKERIDYGAPDGSVLYGCARQVIDGAGTARTLKVSESGALVLFGTAAGQVYTLPAIGANDVGVWFDFCVSVTGTGTYSLDTDAATTFIGGGLAGQSTTAGGADFFPATITSTVSIDLDSTETGEDAGGFFTIVATSTTTWVVGGYTAGSGTLATPFA